MILQEFRQFEPQMNPWVAVAALAAALPPVLFWGRVFMNARRRVKEDERRELEREVHHSSSQLQVYSFERNRGCGERLALPKSIRCMNPIGCWFLSPCACKQRLMVMPSHAAWSVKLATDQVPKRCESFPAGAEEEAVWRTVTCYWESVRREARVVGL